MIKGFIISDPDQIRKKSNLQLTMCDLCPPGMTEVDVTIRKQGLVNNINSLSVTAR